MAIVVRAGVLGDGQALSDIYAASVRGLGARDYRPEQIDAWAGLTPTADNLNARLSDGRLRLIAVDREDRPLGFLDMDTDGHIDLLYVAPDAAGRGCARALLEHAEAHARAAGVARLYAEASETARPVFERLGFLKTVRRDFEVAGVPIHNWAVEKAL
jgi:putative acetyltransferase